MFLVVINSAVGCSRTKGPPQSEMSIRQKRNDVLKQNCSLQKWTDLEENIFEIFERYKFCSKLVVNGYKYQAFIS